MLTHSCKLSQYTLDVTVWWNQQNHIISKEQRFNLHFTISTPWLNIQILLWMSGSVEATPAENMMDFLLSHSSHSGCATTEWLVVTVLVPHTTTVLLLYWTAGWNSGLLFKNINHQLGLPVHRYCPHPPQDTEESTKTLQQCPELSYSHSDSHPRWQFRAV